MKPAVRTDAERIGALEERLRIIELLEEAMWCDKENVHHYNNACSCWFAKAIKIIKGKENA